MDLMRRRLLMAGNGLKDYTIFGKSEVVGSSVLGVGDVKNWNQLVENGNFANGATGWESMVGTTIEDGVCSFTPTSAYNGPTRKVLVAQQSHKYLYVANLYQSSVTSKAYVTGQVGGRNVVIQGTSAGWSQVANIYTEGNSSTIAAIGFGSTATSGWGEIKATNFMVFDLTAIFGSGNEPTSVEGFKSWLVSVGKMKSADGDIPYFPYDAGSTFASLPIVALKGYNSIDLGNLASSVFSYRGNNIFSIATSALEVKPSTMNFILDGYTPIRASYSINDSDYPDMSVKSNASYANTIYIRDSRYTDVASFRAGLSGKVLYYERESATEVSSTTFPLAISSPLHGVGTADFAKFTDKGITRKFGVVDLGSLSWYAGTKSGTQMFYSLSLASVISRPTADSVVANILSAPYTTKSNTTYISTDKSVSVNVNGNLYVRNSDYTDAETFKTAMSGVYLVYELAEETFESVKLPKLPKFKDGTLVYTDTEIHGNITTE